MTIRNLAIVDVGVSNTTSVFRALRSTFSEATVSVYTHASQLPPTVDLAVLPGVGAFGEATERLYRADFSNYLKEHTAGGRPVLGICLGMQLLGDASEESPGSRGLGIIPGESLLLPRHVDARRPRIGWAAAQISTSQMDIGAEWADGDVYFAHSFHFVPRSAKSVLASTEHGSMVIAAALWDPPAMGLQFHPEKSGRAGASVLSYAKALLGSM